MLVVFHREVFSNFHSRLFSLRYCRSSLIMLYQPERRRWATRDSVCLASTNSGIIHVLLLRGHQLYCFSSHSCHIGGVFVRQRIEALQKRRKKFKWLACHLKPDLIVSCAFFLLYLFSVHITEFVSE